MSSEGWKTTTLDEIADINMGQSPSGETCNEVRVGVPLLNGPTEFGSYSPTPIQFTTDPKKIAEKGDILFCVRGSTTGKMNWADQRYAIGRGLASIRHKKGKELQPFLKGIMEYYLPNLLTEATGSTFPNVSSQQLSKLEINIPESIENQTRIASILSSLEEKIEHNRQTNATLETIAQSIFKEWFVNFSFPDSNGEMEISELGLIPKGWRVGKLVEIVELNPRLSLRQGSIAKYVEMKDLSTDSAIIKGFIEREFSSGSKFGQGDTLLARITPCLENGKTGIVNFLREDEVGWGSTEFVVMRGRKFISPYYVYCLSRQTSFRKFAIQSMVGSSGRQRVVESILADFELIIPDEQVLKKYHNTVEPIFNQIKANADQSSTLTLIRNLLLPKLMTGEIEV